MYSCVVIANDEQYAREIASRNSGDDMSEHTHGTAQLTKSALVAHIVKHHPEHIYPGRNGLAKWRMDELTGTHNELHGITRFPEQGPCSSCGTKDDILRGHTMPKVIHLQVDSSTVRCHAPMHDKLNPNGWDLGSVTVNRSEATCAVCLSLSHR